MGVHGVRVGHGHVGHLHRLVAAVQPDPVPHGAVDASHQGGAAVGDPLPVGDDGRGHDPDPHAVLGGLCSVAPAVDPDVVGAVCEHERVDLVGVDVVPVALGDLPGMVVRAVHEDAGQTVAHVEDHAELEHLPLGHVYPEPVLVRRVATAGGGGGGVDLVAIVDVLGLLPVVVARVGDGGGREQDADGRDREKQ